MGAYAVDRVRRLPHDMVYRHPFPGPGLRVRILGEAKPEYAELLRRADAIFIEELRAVETQDFMTAHWAHLPHALLGKVSNRIINEVRGINRVVYDICGKPPATIEWE